MPPPTFRSTCPRCSGRLHLTNDSFGHYLSCLMCGYVHEITEGLPLHEPRTPADSTQRPDAPHQTTE